MPKSKQPTFAFKESYAKLQSIVSWFERDDIDLEEGIKKYEEGSVLAKELQKYLETMEHKIRELS